MSFTFWDHVVRPLKMSSLTISINYNKPWGHFRDIFSNFLRQQLKSVVCFVRERPRKKTNLTRRTHIVSRSSHLGKGRYIFSSGRTTKVQVPCSLYTALCILYMYTLHYKLYTVNCTLYSTLYTVHCILYTIHCIL